jgi:hypothetical protein
LEPAKNSGHKQKVPKLPKQLSSGSDLKFELKDAPKGDVRTPAALEEDVMVAIKAAHKENSFMIAPFCYADIFDEVRTKRDT